MDKVIIGNAIFFVGSLIMVGIGLLRGKKRILLAQCAQFSIMGIAQLILGGITGTVTNIVSILRNLICVRFSFTLPFKLLFMAVQILLTVLVRPVGVIAWFPTAAACLYTWYLDTKSEKVLKVVMILCQFLWVAFDISIQNYVGGAFDVFTIFSTLAGIRMLEKAKRK